MAIALHTSWRMRRRLIPRENNTMKNKALAVQLCLEMAEKRAKARQVPVHSPSAHTGLQDPAMEEVIAAQFRPLPELQRETQVIANRHAPGSL